MGKFRFLKTSVNLGLDMVWIGRTDISGVCPLGKYRRSRLPVFFMGSFCPEGKSRLLFSTGETSSCTASDHFEPWNRLWFPTEMLVTWENRMIRIRCPLVRNYTSGRWFAWGKRAAPEASPLFGPAGGTIQKKGTFFPYNPAELGNGVSGQKRA